jgi:hypothetical protein
MISNTTFTDIKNSFLAISGIASFTPTDEFFLQGSVNLSVKKAYDLSPLWPRYLVVGEARTIDSDQIIAYTQASKNDIGEFIRIHRTEPFKNYSAAEYEFFVDSYGAHIQNIFNTSDVTAYVTYKKNLIVNYTPDSTDIPSEFRDYIIYSALADFYTGDGQNDKAMLANQMANDNLAIQLNKVEIQRNSNIISRRISTHVSRQNRN